MRASATLVAIAIVLLSACATLNSRPTLDGSAWQLTSWSESGSDPAAFTITANFAGGGMQGTSAVNNYIGNYTEGPGQAFKLGQVGSTMMAGPTEAMDAEQTFFRLLDQVRSWQRESGTLTLADAAGKALLVFSPAAPGP